MLWFGEVVSGEALTYQEIEAWGRLTRRIVWPHEAELLHQLDILFRKVNARGRSSSPN